MDIKRLLSIISMLLLTVTAPSGCTHVEAGKLAKLNKSDGWAILPLQNLSETPRAAERAESILQGLLQKKRGALISRAPMGDGKDLALLLNDSLRLEKAKAWARKEKIRYGLTGTIQEWHYKTGLDGEPAIGITLNLIDIENRDKLLWTATASRTGWGSENLTRTSIKVLAALVERMEFRP